MQFYLDFIDKLLTEQNFILSADKKIKHGSLHKRILQKSSLSDSAVSFYHCDVSSYSKLKQNFLLLTLKW